MPDHPIWNPPPPPNGKKLTDVLAFGDAPAGRGTDDRGHAKSAGWSIWHW